MANAKRIFLVFGNQRKVVALWLALTGLNRSADTLGGIMKMANTNNHYVYLYRDNRDCVRYVGYGGKVSRATSHLVASHNPGLEQFLKKGDYRVEVAGPFKDKQTGLTVETTLISVLRPQYNLDPGRSLWRFRPLGVPLTYADRLVEPELCAQDFLTEQGRSPNPVLFVIVTERSFDDARVGYNPANPPTDDQIRQRVDRWWQLERFLPDWTKKSESSPGLLVGVFGSPGRQIVIASARIARDRWSTAERAGGGKIRIPLLNSSDLDAYHLRGRRIARIAGLRFGGISSQFFILLERTGRLNGGQSSPNKRMVSTAKRAADAER